MPGFGTLDKDVVMPPESHDRVDSVRLQDLIETLRSSLLLIIVGVLIGALLAGAYVFTRSPIYTAEATLLPSTEQAAGGLLGQIDFLRTMTGGGSPREDFFENIIKSDAVLDSLIADSWDVEGEPIDLYELMAITADTPPTPIQRDRLKRRLTKDVIQFTKNKLTSFMTLKVHVPHHPKLAAAIANYLLDRLEAFNARLDRAESGEQRRFLEERLADIENEMNSAETRLAEFAASNQGYASSPHQLLQFNRLKRETEALNATWVELRSRYELARIEESRTTHTLTVLDRATPPTRRSRPQRSPVILAGAVLGGLAAFALAWSRRMRRSA